MKKEKIVKKYYPQDLFHSHQTLSFHFPQDFFLAAFQLITSRIEWLRTENVNYIELYDSPSWLNQ